MMIGVLPILVAKKAGWQVDRSYLLYAAVALPACLGAVVAGIGFCSGVGRRRDLLRIAAGLLLLSGGILTAVLVS